jgi:hypothetical protein
MYYAFYILRQEETVMFSQVQANSRVLFTLQQAASIPAFTHAHLDRNPHIQQLTDNTRLSDSMLFYLRGVRKINDDVEFRRRFHLATAGAFKDVDMRKLGAAVTGSILIPCVQTSPLEKGFEDVDWNRERSYHVPYPFMTDNPKTSDDIAFLNFLEYYYPSYVSLTDEDFKTQVLTPPQEVQKPKPVTIDVYDDDEPTNKYVDVCIKELSTREQTVQLTTSEPFIDNVLTSVFDNNTNKATKTITKSESNDDKPNIEIKSDDKHKQSLKPKSKIKSKVKTKSKSKSKSKLSKSKVKSKKTIESSTH